jgi:hypothetical protein
VEQVNENTREILSHLKNVKRCGDGWAASCPAHHDTHASMTVSEGDDGRVLVKCHKGCEFDAIVAAVGVEPSVFFGDAKEPEPVVTDIYPYTDEQGTLLYQVLRWHPKNFTQRVPNGHGGWINRLGDVRRVLYRLPDVLAAVQAGKPVFVCEGEKDANTLVDWGYCATCNSGGARNWRAEYAQSLQGAKVVLLPHNDPDGVYHADSVTRSLKGIAEAVKRVDIPGLKPKGDVTDWRDAGHTKEEFEALLREFRLPSKGVVCLGDAAKWLKYHLDVPLPPGIAYPWNEVTRLTHGMRPGWLIYLAGYTSHGKTAAALDIAVYAGRQGKRVFLISCEMMVEDIAIRLGQRWGLDTRSFIAGRFTDNNRMAVENTLHDPALANIDMVYTKKLSECEDYIERYKPDLLVVDYLQLLDIGKSTRLEGTTKNSQALKDLAIRHSMPVLCLSQLRRPDRDSKPHPPELHDLRDSGSIEQDADQVIFVYREMEEGTRSVTEDGAFYVAKSRMGERGIVEFKFHGSMQKFTIIDKVH